MPTKRKPRSRPWRARRFSPEILELFRKIENGPERGKSYGPQERVLMRELDLVAEWWGGSVLTGEQKPPREWLASYRDWQKCREIRRELLAAVAELELEERSTAHAAPEQ